MVLACRMVPLLHPLPLSTMQIRGLGKREGETPPMPQWRKPTHVHHGARHSLFSSSFLSEAIAR